MLFLVIVDILAVWDWFGVIWVNCESFMHLSVSWCCWLCISSLLSKITDFQKLVFGCAFRSVSRLVDLGVIWSDLGEFGERYEHVIAS